MFLLSMSLAESLGHLVPITLALQNANKVSPDRRACVLSSADRACQGILVIPDELVRPDTIAQYQKYLAETQPSVEYHTTIASFDRINQKRHSLHSIWAKMINSMNGVSQEVSIDLMDHYSTPIALLTDLEDSMTRNGVANDIEDAPTKKRKLKASDPGLHIQQRLERSYQPRSISGPASERIWHLSQNTHTMRSSSHCATTSARYGLSPALRSTSSTPRPASE